jgi:hypothetical protein
METAVRLLRPEGSSKSGRKTIDNALINIAGAEAISIALKIASKIVSKIASIVG